MNKTQAAFAVFSVDKMCETHYLAQWNQHWQRFNLIGGKLEPDESPLECVIREVEEELHLKFEADFIVSPEPVQTLDLTEVSERSGELTEYHMTFFAAEFTRPELCDSIVERSENRWLSLPEMMNEQTTDDLAISRLMSLALQKHTP